MKDTISVNKRRRIAYTKKENYDECWKISHKYSHILMKNINSEDLYNTCCSVYGEYITELKSKGLSISDKKGRNKNYIQVWITLLNTVKKGEVEKQAVRILHQTNCQRSC